MRTSSPLMPCSSSRRRLMTRLVGRPPRSASGFRLMNMRPWLTDGVEARAADRRADVLDRRVGQHDVERLRLQLEHRLEGDVGRGLACEPKIEARVVLREIALGRSCT